MKIVLAMLVLASITIALLMGELLARFVVNPGDFLSASLVSHPVLGRRIMPYTTGHDALGFRNPEVPARAGIIAVGDSMTYGINAARDGTWPHQLGSLLGEPVYNMGLGSYGPLQYLYLAEHEARKLQPRLLLVGFYFGNDLIDAFSLAHEEPHWHGWREGSSGDARVVKSGEFATGEPKKRFAGLRDWLSSHSVLYSMLRVTLFQRFAAWEQERMASQLNPEQRMVWRDPHGQSVSTIFTPELRLSAVDPGRPDVQEGLRITKRAFAALESEATANGTKLLVVLIPTKERAYCRYLKDSGERMPAAFLKVCDAEEWIKEDLVRFFATRKIAYVDVRGAMEEKIRNHVEIYPATSDSHPQVFGYGVIARAVYDALRRQQHEN